MDMNEMSEGAVLVGVGKPEMKVPPVVEPATVSTPEQLVDEVVQSSTKQQILDLFREYGSNAKKYFSSLGKAVGAVAVGEGVKTLQGARELKLKNAQQKDNQIMAVEQVRTKGKTILEASQTDYAKGTVTHSTFQVETHPDGTKTTTKTTSKDAAPPIIGLDSGEPKKGFWGNAQKAYKEGKKYELGEEAKSKKQEGMINAVGDYVTNTVLQPYPDVPRPITALSSAVSSFIPDKGIQFIPAIWETAVARVKMVKGEIDITKRLWGVIKDSPEARGAKNNFEAAYRVVRSILKKDIDKMKTPEANQAAAVFA